jgi:hypothetical protein
MHVHGSLQDPTDKQFSRTQRLGVVGWSQLLLQILKNRLATSSVHSRQQKTGFPHLADRWSVTVLAAHLEKWARHFQLSSTPTSGIKLPT